MQTFKKELEKLEANKTWMYLIDEPCFGTNHNYELWVCLYDDSQQAEVCRHCETIVFKEV